MTSNFIVHQGGAVEVLKTMPAKSIHTCITSPPYFGLREFGTPQWEGGDVDCTHVNKHSLQGATGMRADRNFTGSQNFYKKTCKKCGANRVDPPGSIGLEETPAEYIAKLVEVFREVGRVLRDDGTIWVNVGDGWAHDAKWGGASGGKLAASLHGETGVGRGRTRTGLKPKDLIGIPWELAFALRADGWYLRSEIIWSKPSPMPEPVKDRPTKAHEQIFLLSKNKKYYYDADAIAEPATSKTKLLDSSDLPNSGGTTRPRIPSTLSNPACWPGPLQAVWSSIHSPACAPPGSRRSRTGGALSGSNYFRSTSIWRTRGSPGRCRFSQEHKYGTRPHEHQNHYRARRGEPHNRPREEPGDHISTG